MKEKKKTTEYKMIMCEKHRLQPRMSGVASGWMFPPTDDQGLEFRSLSLARDYLSYVPHSNLWPRQGENTPGAGKRHKPHASLHADLRCLQHLRVHPVSVVCLTAVTKH